MARKRNSKQLDKGKVSESSKSTEDKVKSEVDEKDHEKEAKEKAKNDPAWYARDERLLIDSASIPFSIPFGSSLKMDTSRNPLTSGTMLVENVANVAGRNPGIMVFYMNPSYGASKDALSPMNVAANAIYSHVRYVNNGRKNYDPADLFIYLAAVTELYSYVTWLRRIYGCAFPYSQANWYLGKPLLRAQGINADDVVANLANFRYQINAFLNKVAAYAIPADISLIFKKAFMYGSVYLEHDGESVKDQMYLYNPRSFYKYVLDYQHKGALMRHVVPVSPNASDLGLGVADLMAIGEDLLSNIWGDEDFGLMSGDILRAFEGNIVRLESLPEDFWVVPQHDKLVLTQMENTTILDADINNDPTEEPTTGYFKLTGDVGETKFLPGCIMQSGTGLLVNMEVGDYAFGFKLAHMNEDDLEAAYDKILNIHEVSGDPATVIESIQNMVSAVGNAAGAVQWSAPYTNDHMIVADTNAYFCSKVLAWSLDDGPVFGQTTFKSVDIHQNINTQIGETGGTLTKDKLKVALNFKYCPKMFWTQGEIRTGAYAFFIHELLGRLDTYAQISNENLSYMIQTSLLSLLYVPGVAKYVNALS